MRLRVRGAHPPMKTPQLLASGLALLLAGRTEALTFVVAGGQIFTPGILVVDAPQPGTPLGGGEN